MSDNINKEIEKAGEIFKKILIEQIERNEKIKHTKKSNKSPKDSIIIGICEGDGIGPVIIRETLRVLNILLDEELRNNKIILKNIEGLTIENRLKQGKTVPDEVYKEMKKCDVILKGPTTTPSENDGTKNIESANVYLRKAFDLYANVRPVSLPGLGIDWIFFRENTEGEYALGSSGISIKDKLSLDFKVTTRNGTERIARAAFDYAKANGKKKVSIVTKANIMKKTDGDFLRICREVGSEYEDIEIDSWFVDIMAANLINKQIRKGFSVFILPNLYGDIITDEAAQIQGGVGTAGSGNIGDDMAIFEAIHGSAPRMVKEGLMEKANPASLMKAASMMLHHIGANEKSERLERAVDAVISQIGMKMEGLADSLNSADFTDKVIENLKA